MIGGKKTSDRKRTASQRNAVKAYQTRFPGRMLPERMQRILDEWVEEERHEE